ncbi:MAG: glutathione S-transferase family protein [Pseudomonadota bacterium]
MSIKLYELCSADPAHLFSPHCWKTRMSLAHKGLDFETVATPFTGIAGVEGGPARRVPVLRDGETVIEESLEIAKYLDANYPDAPSLLKGEGGAALTELVITWSQTQVHPAVVKLCLMDIFNALAPEDQVFFRATREKAFGKTLEEFQAQFDQNDNSGLVASLLPVELMLKKQPFIGGDTPLFADYVVFGALQWLRTSAPRDVMPKDSAVAGWFERLLDMYDGAGRRVPAAYAA